MMSVLWNKSFIFQHAQIEHVLYASCYGWFKAEKD